MHMSVFVSTGLYRPLNVSHTDTASFRPYYVLSYTYAKVLVSKLWNMKNA